MTVRGRQGWGHALERECAGVGRGLRGSGRVRRCCRQHLPETWLLQVRVQGVVVPLVLAATVLHWEVACVVPQLVGVRGPVLPLLQVAGLPHRRGWPARWVAAVRRAADTLGKLGPTARGNTGRTYKQHVWTGRDHRAFNCPLRTLSVAPRLSCRVAPNQHPPAHA